MSFDQLMPVFLSTPVSHEEARLPFRFVGGFGLPTKTIGLMLSIQGAYSMVAQLFLFPFVVRRFGVLNTFRIVVMSWPLLYFATPYLVLLPSRCQMAGILLCLLWRITAQVLSYPSNAILLTNSAPSMLVLGLINGVAASTASLSRALGPTISGMIHSWGLSMGVAGLAWWASGVVCIFGAIESLWMEEGKGRMDKSEEEDEEASVGEAPLDTKVIDAALAKAASRAEDQSSDA
jgi:hypothetical protein